MGSDQTEAAIPKLKTVHTTSRLPSKSQSNQSSSDTPKDERKPFLAHLTLDTLSTVLRNSIFHPFITLLIPICLRAQATPYTHLSFKLTTGWAILVSLYHILISISHRTKDGPPREFEWEEQVIVVTGGGRGLGRLLVEVLGLRGVGVAVLDVRERPEGIPGEEEGVRWYVCDVGNRGQVEECARRIRKELGPPTILINNAAAPIDPLPLSSLSPNSINHTLNTNLHAAFYTISAFLPDLLSSPTGGHLITISSVLAYFAPAHLTTYAASKAALSAFHHSLTHELRASGDYTRVKTTLVETGQLATELFQGLETPNRFLAPVLETREVVREIVKSIDRGEGGVVRLPEYAKWVDWYAVLPEGFKVAVRWFSGVDRATAGIHEREKRKAVGEKGA